MDNASFCYVRVVLLLVSLLVSLIRLITSLDIDIVPATPSTLVIECSLLVPMSVNKSACNRSALRTFIAL